MSRSSKRQRIDATASTLFETPTKHKSAHNSERLAADSKSAKFAEPDTPIESGKGPDVYDDIEGALEKRTRRGARRAQTQRKEQGNEILKANGAEGYHEEDELAIPTKARSEGRSTKSARVTGRANPEQQMTPVRERGKRKLQPQQGKDTVITSNGTSHEPAQSSGKIRSGTEKSSRGEKDPKDADELGDTAPALKAVRTGSKNTRSPTVHQQPAVNGNTKSHSKSSERRNTKARTSDKVEAPDDGADLTTFGAHDSAHFDIGDATLVPSGSSSPFRRTPKNAARSVKSALLRASLGANQPSATSKPPEDVPNRKVISIASAFKLHVPERTASNQERLIAPERLATLKKIVLEKLTGKRPIPLVGLEEEYKKVRQVFEQTIMAGEGNSMLLIGSRGSGKTALVNRAISDMSQEHNESFHVVRLSGFVQTDDKLALREIWRQLGREMDIEEDSSGKNYADTLSTILALLSHPCEQEEPAVEAKEPTETRQETQQVAKSVVFIMDEFDLFATHPRQTLLYNLFDIAQSRKAPIVVLGLTTRIDVSESLEKRVKSRFSHRYVHVSAATSIAVFQDMCAAALQLHKEELTFEERAELVSSARDQTDPLTAWNCSVSDLLADAAFQANIVAPHFHLSKSLPALLSTLLVPLSTLSADSLPLSSHFTSTLNSIAPTLAAPDSKLSLLSYLSTLQLSLLIAACRLDVLLDASACNFNMAYAEYVSLASKARVQSAAAGSLATGGAAAKVWRKDVARKEWERLVAYELLVPVAGGSAGVGGEMGTAGMVRVDVGLEEIAPSVGQGMDKVLEKWCRQL